MNNIAAADAAEIVTLCNIAGRPRDAAAFIASGTSVAKVRAELQRQSKQPTTTNTEVAFRLFDPGIGIRIGEVFDHAAVEEAARASGRLR